ncbi:MAG: ATP-binding protein [Ghiorsea sp.]
MINQRAQKLNQADRVEEAMIRSYTDQALKTEVVGLLTGMMMALFFWNDAHQHQLVIWLLILVSGPFIHHVFIHRFLCDKLNTKQIRNGIELFWFASGCLWGWLILICLDATSSVNVAILTGLTAGMLAGAFPGASMLRFAYILFATPLCLIYSFVMFPATGADLSIMALLGLIMLGLMLMISRQLNHDFKQSITLRFENIELVEKLKKTNADKTRFLASASHDLRQPHQALGLFLESLDHLESDATKKGIIGKTKQAFQSMSGLLDQLLDISKIDSGTMHPEMKAIALQPFLHHMIMEYMEKAEQQGLELRLRPTDAVVYADPAMLRRIVSNLLSNAVRYTNQGGILVGVRRRHLNWRLIVCDTGRGIPDEDKDHIFQEFIQLENPERDREKGLGLGLAIVRRLSEMMEAKVSVHSVQNSGTCFSLELAEANISEVSKETVRHIDDVTGLVGLHVAIVDDDKIAREGLATLLKVWGCNVQAFVSGEACVEHLTTSAWLPDKLIVDYRLRENTTGVGVIQQIHRCCEVEVPALVITGDTAPDRIKEAEQGGFPLLHKPVSAERLKHFLLTVA